MCAWYSQDQNLWWLMKCPGVLKCHECYFHTLSCRNLCISIFFFFLTLLFFLSVPLTLLRPLLRDSSKPTGGYQSEGGRWAQVTAIPLLLTECFCPSHPLHSILWIPLTFTEFPLCAMYLVHTGLLISFQPNIYFYLSWDAVHLFFNQTFFWTVSVSSLWNLEN